MPYVWREPRTHVCELPHAELVSIEVAMAIPDDDAPRKGDIWECPTCGRQHKCTGWGSLLPGLTHATWRRVWFTRSLTYLGEG
jgi:hypothetical protein